jgi:hypothetical protein
MTIKRQSEYTAAQWADLYPEARYAAMQAEADYTMGRTAIPTRAADGRSVVYFDPVTGQPVATPTVAPARRMG